MFHIYVLKLKSGKYYVGKTRNLNTRIKQHFSNKYNSAWTNKYKPLKLEYSFESDNSHAETNKTLDLMDHYGINNVRGGAYCMITLNKSTEANIRHLIKHSKDLCYNCGGIDHFTNNCPYNKSKCKDKEENMLFSDSEDGNESDYTSDVEIVYKSEANLIPKPETRNIFTFTLNEIKNIFFPENKKVAY